MICHLSETVLTNREIASALLQGYVITAGPFKGMVKVYWGDKWHLYRATQKAYALVEHRESFLQANLYAKSGITYLTILAAR